MENNKFSGIVIRGKNRGKKLGYPTANVLIEAIFKEGVYVSETVIDKKKLQSITFIGNAKTFNEHDYQSETYILDFNRDIYDQKIEVKLLKKIRDNQKFESVDALILQMKKDEEEARKYLNEYV